ncbi:hypothetical protein LPW36_13930 [Jinshanibacter sp. LJY008]|uniref:Amidohydrolase n=1 Tax=Limnobaculum eriocheiris TaxID=2897391 RepID=A0A9X1MZH3_9GAMM|nr:hypothetical protein [Limnobaculum eriocheiris]MCD1127080.1 hypothetical protein [Limnobaculum eriocheiris]
MSLYDLIIKNVHLKDPINKTDGLMDIGIADGKIAVTQADIPIIQAKKVTDLTEYTAIPGIIDPHTHVSEFWGSNNGQTMLAKAEDTMLDIESRTPIATIVGGNMVMYKGLVCGQGSTIICTRQGEASLKKRGIKTCVADPSQKPLAMSTTR